MKLKEKDKRFGMDSAGLGEVLMVTCCELRDKPPVFTKELEFYFQVVGYQFHMKRFPLWCLSLFDKFLTRHRSSHRRVRNMVPWGLL